MKTYIAQRLGIAVLTLFGMSIVIFVLLGGVLADRVPRRRLLATSDLVKGTAQVATAALLFTGAANVGNVALLQIAFGVANALSGCCRGCGRPLAAGSGLLRVGSEGRRGRRLASVVRRTR